ncbi:hypothetical protein FB451DRAFT_1558947 [Mycena latifolia]|nr:hypothetical protein FB451DRAFT_1558947 [Mycena latifolia]
MSQTPCNALCSFHCTTERQTGAMDSPYPELHSSASTPFDSQIPVIWKAIDRAEADISTTDHRLMHLQSTIEQLKRHRAELEDFAKSHRAMVSAFRRLPTEILSKIFVESVDVNAKFDPRRNEPWIIAQVCHRWRAVAITSPRLWRHFNLPYTRNGPNLRPALTLQLERASNAPLSIRFRPQFSLDVLKLFLAASPRWEVVTLDLRDNEFAHFIGGSFPTLKLLTLRSWEPLMCTDDVDMLESLPALKHLKLDLTEALPRRLLLPWSQLRTCTLVNFHSLDALWILSQLSPKTAVSLIRGANVDGERSTSHTTSPIKSLKIDACGEDFAEDLLTSLVAPTLEEFHFECLEIEGETVDHIRSFLDNSMCPLTQLRIHTRSVLGDDLIHILETSHSHSIVHLDVFSTAISNHSLDALSSQRVVPHLRTLVLRGHGEFDPAHLLMMLGSRTPVLRSVRSAEFPGDMDLHSASAAGGLQLIVIDDE